MDFVVFLVLFVATIYGYKRWLSKSRPDKKPLLPFIILINSFAISVIIHSYVQQRAEVASYEWKIVMSYNNEPSYYSPVYVGANWTFYSVVFTPIIGLISLILYFKSKQYDEKVFSEQKNFLVLFYFLAYLPLSTLFFVLISLNTPEKRYYLKDTLPPIGTRIIQH